MKYNMGFTDKKPGSRKAHSTFQMSSSNLLKSNSSRSNYRNIKKFNPFAGIGLGKNKAGKKADQAKMGSNKRSFKKIFKKTLAIFTGFLFFSVVIGVVVVGIYLKQIEGTLPKPGQLLERSSDQSTIILDRNGKELYRIFKSDGENRQYIKLEDLSPEARRNVIVSVLAAEDQGFYTHKGLDIVGIVRCGIISVKDYATGSGEGCGASTLSQQLVRNTILKDTFGEAAFERSTFFTTAERKLKEMLVTMQVEQTMTKDQILEMYINEIFMGNVNYGFQAGSKYFFDKDVKDLSLAETALMAGVIQSPSRFNPINGTHPEEAKEKQAYVFEQMKKHKDSINDALAKEDLPLLTDEIIEQAKNEELVYKEGQVDNILAPHFVFYVRDQLIEKYGVEKVETGGLKVTTSLDYETQQIAEEEVRNGINNVGIGQGFNVYNGALFAFDPKTGQILSMVGSVDYFNNSDPRVDGNVNVLLSNRQMGSSVKPIVYLSAFLKGLGPWMQAPDVEQLDFSPYKPKNWDSSAYGFMTAREALVKSRNLSAVYATQYVGVDSFIQNAEKMGITTLTDTSNYGLSIGIGAGGMKVIEHAQTFGVYAAEGIKRPLVSILKVEDNKGNVLEEFKENPGERVFDEKPIYELNWTLCDLGGFGDQLTNWNYVQGGKRIACGKTGTTDGSKDLTAFLYNKNIVVAVWAGNNDNSLPVGNAFSTNIPLPIASAFIRRTIGKYPTEMFSRPAGIAATTVCNDTGALPGKDDDCPKTPSIYVVGQGPRTEERTNIEVCKTTGLIPTNLEFAKANDLVETVRYLNYEIDNKDQDENFKKYLATLPGPKFVFKQPETGECKLPLGVDNAPVISIQTPKATDTFDTGETINFTVATNAQTEVAHVQYQLDNINLVGGKITTSPYSFDYVISHSVTTGSHTFTAIVTDDTGKTSFSTVIVEITNATPSPTITLTLTAPKTVELATFTAANPVGVVVTQNSGTLSAVTLYINGTGTNAAYTKTVTMSNGGSGLSWSGNWTFDAGIVLGDYTVQAKSGSIVSNTETIKVK